MEVTKHSTDELWNPHKKSPQRQFIYDGTEIFCALLDVLLTEDVQNVCK